MLQRKSLRKTKKSIKKKKPVIRKKKPETWLEVKREIRPKFEEAGIRCCELLNNLEFIVAIEKQLGKKQNCTECYPLYLTFAHSLRRRKIGKHDMKTQARLLREVIRACQNCHKLLDSLYHNTTSTIVRNVIDNRVTPV